MIAALRQMVNRFLEVIDCVDVAFIEPGLLDALSLQDTLRRRGRSLSSIFWARSSRGLHGFWRYSLINTPDRALEVLEQHFATNRICQSCIPGKHVVGFVEQIDLGMQIGKVAWVPDARRVAFAIPNQADGRGPRRAESSELAGLFVFDPTPCG